MLKAGAFSALIVTADAGSPDSDKTRSWVSTSGADEAACARRAAKDGKLVESDVTVFVAFPAAWAWAGLAPSLSEPLLHINRYDMKHAVAWGGIYQLVFQDGTFDEDARPSTHQMILTARACNDGKLQCSYDTHDTF